MKRKRRLAIRVLAAAPLVLGIVACDVPLPDESAAIAGPANAVAELRVATWNLEWFNDHDRSDDDSKIGRDFAAPSAAEFASRVRGVSDAIAELDAALVALQEVENERVVEAIATDLEARHDRRYRVAFAPGHDVHTGQEVALLARDDVTLRGVRRFDFRPFRGRSGFKNLSKHVRVDAVAGGERLSLVVVHLVTSPDRRIQQARTLRAWIEDHESDGRVIVLGDFNTGQRFNETTPESEIGIVRGFGTPDTADDLFDCHQLLADRATHSSGRELDRILVGPALLDDVGLRLAAIETRRDLAIRGRRDRGRDVAYHLDESEQDLSDHYPLIATFTRADL